MLALGDDYVVGGCTDDLFRAELERIGPHLWKMLHDTVGGTGEMHVRFKNGRIVEEGRLGFSLTVNSD